jgi:hypothetical protein
MEYRRDPNQLSRDQIIRLRFNSGESVSKLAKELENTLENIGVTTYYIFQLVLVINYKLLLWPPFAWEASIDRTHLPVIDTLR